MTYDERTVVHRDETDAPASATTDRSTAVTSRTVEMRPSGGTVAGRVVIFIFGVIQALIVLRIVLLLLNAREGNDVVQFILNASQPFVAPFIGIFNVDALKSSGSILDIAAIAALVGWTVLEAIVLWGVNVMRREPV